MALFNRLLALAIAVLLALGGALAAVVALGYAADLPGVTAVGRFLTSLSEQPADVRYWTAAGGSIASLLGLLLLALEARTASGPRDLLIEQSKMGRVSISLAGLARLAEHVIGEIGGIRSVVSQVRPTRQGLRVHCRISVDPDGSVPELSAEIRRRLEAALVRHVGQPAARLQVYTRVAETAISRKRVQ